MELVFLIMWFSCGLLAWVWTINHYGAMSVVDLVMLPVNIVMGGFSLAIAAFYIGSPTLWKRK